MNNLEHILTYDPETWLKTLPTYQRNLIDNLYQTLNNYDDVSIAWLSTSVPMNVPFGSGNSHSIFFDKLLDEFEYLLTGHEKYKECRLSLLKESGVTQHFIVATISSTMAPHIGASAPFLAPVVALSLLTISKMGTNAWIAKRQENRNLGQDKHNS